MNKIIYLDAAASYLKSDKVIATQIDYLQHHYANAGRGICERAQYTDNMIAKTRQVVAEFMNAKTRQIVFTTGTTDAMNMIVQMLNLSPATVVAVSDLDHHSARLPFVQSGAKVKVCALDENFNIDATNIPCADVFVITAMSNVLGVAQNVAQLVKCARRKNPNVITVVDAAQFVVHENINVVDWDCDFVCWSGHKIGADTGVGVMYIKNPDVFLPVKFGGGMVTKISGDEIIFNHAPDVFEAGTLPLTQIAGLNTAITEIKNNRPDLNLIKYLYDNLSNVSKIKMLSQRDATVCSFVVENMHVLDFGALIGAKGVCLRVGNMCATWIHQLLEVDSSIRISVGTYNTIDDINAVIKYIKDMVK